ERVTDPDFLAPEGSRTPTKRPQHGSDPTPLLSRHSSREFDDNVDVAQMAGVLLLQVQQDPLECRRFLPPPVSSGPSPGLQVVCQHDVPAYRTLGLQFPQQ